MILRQFLHTDPVIAASYLFGCGGHAAGAVVDPVGEPGRYLDAAAALGLRLRFVIDTHVHADHLSPGRELAAEAPPPTSRTGASSSGATRRIRSRDSRASG